MTELSSHAPTRPAPTPSTASHTHFRHPRNVGRREARGHLHRDGRQDDTQRPARHRQEQALAHEGTYHLEPARAHGHPERDFPLAAFGAHQQEVGDVGARDDQHEAHRAEENPQGPADVAHDLVFERSHHGAELHFFQERRCPVFREQLREATDEPLQLRVGSLERGRVREPRDSGSTERRKWRLGRIDLHRDEELHVRVGIAEAEPVNPDETLGGIN